MKHGLLATASLAFVACGNIPVASVALPPVKATIPVNFESPVSGDSPVIYINENQLKDQQIPGAIRTFVNNLTVDGTARYFEIIPGTSDVRKIELYVRQTLSPLPESCTLIGKAVFCSGNESAQRVGEIDFVNKPNLTTPFTMGGPVLLASLKAQPPSLYIGFRIAGGKLNEGDRLELTNMRANAKF